MYDDFSNRPHGVCKIRQNFINLRQRLKNITKVEDIGGKTLYLQLNTYFPKQSSNPNNY
jgi:hypothetical protein